jgi:hypothetical protein
MDRFHDLSIVAVDADGDTYRHVLALHEAAPDTVCVECQRPATVAHPRYPVRLVESCRGLPLCSSTECRMRHLTRHLRELNEARAA